MARCNVFVLGLDEPNLAVLRALPGAERLAFHGLLGTEETLFAPHIRLPDLLGHAERRLAAFAGSVDAIVGYWDFPVSSMVPLLCQQRGLPGPNLDAVVKCEHKYWSRLEQSKVIDDHPRFAVIDLDRPDRPPSGLRYPMWLKPVKSVASELAYRVADERQFAEAVRRIRAGVDRFAEPFELVLGRLELPEEVAAAGARACLAEEEISGRQLTLEGYCLDGQVHVYGVVESVRYPGTSSFWRYEYPAMLPRTVEQRLVGLSTKVMRQVGLRLGTFNIEYFWDPVSGAVSLLEINPRHSQSHAVLFGFVDGVPNHHHAVQLALGRDPHVPRRRGRYRVAAKWFLRRFADGIATRVPTTAEVDEIESRTPGVKVQVLTRAGEQLSRMHRQDSYSYQLAAVHVGATNRSELAAKYQQCVQALRFEFMDTPEIYPHLCELGLAARQGTAQDSARSPDGFSGSGACQCSQQPGAVRPP